MGDSLSMQMHEAMYCMAGTMDIAKERVLSLREDQLWVKKDDTKGDTEAVVARVAGQFSAFFMKINVTDNDILVLNSGAHLHVEPDDAFALFRIVAQALKRTFQGTVIFRGSPMGHEYCWAHFAPLSAERAEDLKASTTSWNWKSLSAFNTQIVRAFRESHVGRFHFLDTAMYDALPVGHYQEVVNRKVFNWGYFDCLHMCSAGPVVGWVRLLHHLLVELGRRGE